MYTSPYSYTGRWAFFSAGFNEPVGSMFLLGETEDREALMLGDPAPAGVRATRPANP